MQTTSPYKTAADLGIEQWEHDGLVALIGPLSRGELAFSMRYPGRDYCGSVHCLGGWLAFYRGLNPHAYLDTYAHPRTSLCQVFYPGGTLHPREEEHRGWESSAHQAARAIVNFLTLGDPRWDDVMREAA